MSVTFVPNNKQANAVTLTSSSYSLIVLCLAAHGINLQSHCSCGECDLHGPSIHISTEQVEDVCIALTEIFAELLRAGLSKGALEVAFLLSVVAQSGGMRAEVSI